MCIKYNNVSVAGQHIALAKKYETEGRFNDAYKEYFALIKSEPHNRRITMMLPIYYLNQTNQCVQLLF
jgi:hypothetical protein